MAKSPIVPSSTMPQVDFPTYEGICIVGNTKTIVGNEEPCSRLQSDPSLRLSMKQIPITSPRTSVPMSVPMNFPSKIDSNVTFRWRERISEKHNRIIGNRNRVFLELVHIEAGKMCQREDCFVFLG